MPTVRLTDPRSASQQVADHIAEQIRAGDLAVGTVLPSVRAMVASWRVGTETIRTALNQLQASGLVVRRHGVGTYVTDWKPAASTLDTPPEGTTRNTTTSAGVPTSTAAAALGIDPNAWVDIDDHQDIDGTGRLVARTVVTHPSTDPETFTPGHTHDVVQARSGADAQLLNLPAGTPVLVQCRTVTDTNGRPRQYSETVQHGAIAQLHIVRPVEFL